MKRWALPLALLALATATSSCDVEAARGSTAPAAADGGEKASARKPKAQTATAPRAEPDAGSRPDAGTPANDDDEVVDLSEPVMGLTRAQVRARRGSPTEIRGSDWIYTPDQEGCRDVIINEVLTFRGGVVVRFHLQRRQTGKVCRMR